MNIMVCGRRPERPRQGDRRERIGVFQPALRGPPRATRYEAS